MRYEPSGINFHLGETPPREPQRERAIVTGFGISQPCQSLRISRSATLTSGLHIGSNQRGQTCAFHIASQSRVAALIAEHHVDAIIHFVASIVVPDLRLRPRLFGARRDRDSQVCLRSRFRGGVFRPAPGRPRTHRRRVRSCSCHAQMAAAFRRSANRRHPRACLGAQAFNACHVTRCKHSSIPLESLGKKSSL